MVSCDLHLSIHHQLYFVGSGFSFYFVYDFCLYDGMSSQMAYFLRFIPLFVALLTLTLTMFIRWETTTLSLCILYVITCSIVFRLYITRKVLVLKPLEYHGVWWVVLLLYSHVVYTSMTIFNCPSITDKLGTTSAVRKDMCKRGGFKKQN